MNYISTRGGYATDSSAEALLMTCAPDGGLLVPETLPFYDAAAWKELATLPAPKRIARVLAGFLPELSIQELEQMTEAAYRSDQFASPEIAKLTNLNPYVNDSYLLELNQGPTGAYPDGSMHVLPYLLSWARKRLDQSGSLKLLVATVGEAGSSLLGAIEAYEAMRGQSPAVLTSFVPLVLLPHRGPSIFSKLLLSYMNDRLGVHCLPEGGGEEKHSFSGICETRLPFDAIQDLLQREGQLASNRMKDGHAPSWLAVNALSWCRLLPQIACLISAFAEWIATQDQMQPMNVVVPGSSFGCLMAVWYARQMGAPIARIVVSSNRNKAQAEFFGNGKYDCCRDLQHTCAPGMDQMGLGNLERLLFAVTSQDAPRVNSWMQQFEAQGRFQVEADVLRRLQAVFVAGYADDRGILKTLREIYDRTDYCVDTHAAAGMNVYQRYRQRSRDALPVLYFAPAHPLQTAEGVYLALNPKEKQFVLQEHFLPLAEEIGVPLPTAWEAAWNLYFGEDADPARPEVQREFAQELCLDERETEEKLLAWLRGEISSL